MKFLHFVFNSFIDLKSSDSYSLRRLTLLSWWAVSGEERRQLCAGASNSQSQSNQEHTHLSPAKRKSTGKITAVERTTTTECPDLQDFKFRHAPYSGILTGSTK